MPSDDPWLTGSILQTAATVTVYRWTEELGLEELPHVECVGIRISEGPDPGGAAFRYNLAYSGGPNTIEQALSTDYTGPNLVEPGDNLIVKATSPTGYYEYLFDGHVVGFDGSLSPGQEEVTIQAEGIAKRLWDVPIGNALYRECNNAFDATANVETHHPVHFNRGGEPNASPEDADVALESHEDWTHPAFFDQDDVRTEDVRRYWDLSMATKYLLYRHNDETWVLNPPPEEIDLLSGEGEPIDPLDPSPTRTPLYVPDLHCDGRDMLSTVFELVREYGFGLKLDLDSTTSPPTTVIKFFHAQSGDLKDVDLPLRGTAYSPYICNVQSLRVSRSLSEVANAWEVWGHLERYEASFVLAPGFSSTSTDGAASNLSTYDSSNSNFLQTNFDSYRTWVFNESGDGYYENGSTSQLTAIPSLDSLLDPKDDQPYVNRRRKPLGTLFTLGTDFKPLKATLAISQDYAGDYPALWDGTGTWQPVTTSSWKLLRDRIGIHITEDNPNQWNIGKSSVSGHPYRGGIVRAVEAISGSEATIPEFFLRLTCVIEGDHRLKGVASRRDRSPLSHEVTRYVDFRDRYFKDYVGAKSQFNTGTTRLLSRDDTTKAEDDAEARRAAAELGVLEGVIQIPYLTTYYRVGDRIRQLSGRDLGFRTDGTVEETAPPTYPVVTGITWQLQGRQSTTLQISDAGTARFKYARRMQRSRKDG